MKNSDVSKKISCLSGVFITGITAGIAGYAYLKRKQVKDYLLTTEAAGILKEVWGDLHNACYGDTTIYNNTGAEAYENKPGSYDITDIETGQTK